MRYAMSRTPRLETTMHLDATDAVTMRTDGREPNALGTNGDAATSSSNSLFNFSDSPFVDDDSWAEPPRAADRRLQIAAVMLGLGVMAIGFFTLGAKMGKNSAATPTAGPGALGGRGAGFGGAGFGGAGAGGGGFGGRARALLPTIGKVTNIDGSTITMTSTDGTTVVVTLAEDTSIGRRKKQGVKNIAVGDDISVRGATAEDGSITATAATVGDVEPSAVPAAGAIGAGGARGAGGAGGVSGADGSAVADPAQSGVGGVTPAAVAGSGLEISVAPNEPLPPTSVPSLGGLLPG
jgi:Domain of unknown function (DUF5666)